MEPQQKRVVVIYWKHRGDNPIEVYSSLKNFCLTYKEYNYNTLSHYLGKRKVAFDNDKVRIERKQVILKPATIPEAKVRSIVPVVRKVAMKEANDYLHDLNYWLEKLPQERVLAVTDIILQSLDKGRRMDKGRIVKRKLKV